MSTKQNDSTLAIHGGRTRDAATGAILTPIYQNTAYGLPKIGADAEFTYSRKNNPTVAVLEEALGAFENAEPAVCFGSGMAAITGLLLTLLEQGDRVVVGDAVYGGTTHLLRAVLPRFGIEAIFVDSADADAVRDAIDDRTKLVLVETPANPTLKLTDLLAAAEVCRAADVPLAVDNTFLTAAQQRPLDLGADIVVYSTTKFIEGHNATVGGALVTRDPELRARFQDLRKFTGSIQTPWQAWLTLRGLKTLPLRVAQQSTTALTVAGWLEEQPQVSRVHYPGLASFPQRELAERQQTAGGGLVAFELAGGVAAAVSLLNNVQLCTLAENLGAVETLITHPATMTHVDVPAETRRAAGIADGLVRLSLGLESAEDVVADLARALVVEVDDA